MEIRSSSALKPFQYMTTLNTSNFHISIHKIINYDGLSRWFSFVTSTTSFGSSEIKADWLTNEPYSFFCNESYIFLLPFQLVLGTFEFVNPFAECVLCGDSLSLLVIVRLMERVVDCLAETCRRLHLGIRTLLVVTTVVLPLLRSGAPTETNIIVSEDNAHMTADCKALFLHSKRQ